MSRVFSYRELRAIAATRQSIAMRSHGETDHGLIKEIIGQLVLDDCLTVTQYSAALIPISFRPTLAEYLAELRNKNYAERISLIGPGFSDAEQAAFQPKFQAIADQLQAFLDDPVVPADMPTPDADLFWARINELPRRKGVNCKQQNCTADAIEMSVYCPAHHYEQIKGTCPPH